MSDEHPDLPPFNHPTPVRLLYMVFFALVGLTIVTVVANDLPLGALDIWVAMGIATLKATLVALFFMHMWWEKGFNVVAFLSSFLFVFLFVGLTLMDTDNYKESIENFPVKERPAAEITPGSQST